MTERPAHARSRSTCSRLRAVVESSPEVGSSWEGGGGGGGVGARGKARVSAAGAGRRVRGRAVHAPVPSPPALPAAHAPPSPRSHQQQHRGVDEKLMTHRHTLALAARDAAAEETANDCEGVGWGVCGGRGGEERCSACARPLARSPPPTPPTQPNPPPRHNRHTPGSLVSRHFVRPSVVITPSTRSIFWALVMVEGRRSMAAK